MNKKRPSVRFLVSLSSTDIDVSKFYLNLAMILLEIDVN